ncbi:MAG: hypothetical protein ACXAEU_03750 [Candidatus Hodarchaeales archaeon]
MPIVKNTFFEENKTLVLGLRLVAGLIWFGTVVRRLLVPNFYERIAKMGQGDPLLPDFIMELAIENWTLIFLVVLSIEILASTSLLTGTFARGGAFLATINGFLIGLAGIGVGIGDLLVPWSAALITLVLFLFTHPGMYRGLDEKLSEKNLPRALRIFI